MVWTAMYKLTEVQVKQQDPQEWKGAGTFGSGICEVCDLHSRGSFKIWSLQLKPRVSHSNPISTFTRFATSFLLKLAHFSTTSLSHGQTSTTASESLASHTCFSTSPRLASVASLYH